MTSVITRTACPCCGSVFIGKVLTCKDYTVSLQVFDIWQCGDCTLRFTQDAPDNNFIGRYYQSSNYVSHTDTEKGFINKIYKIARGYTLNWKMALLKENVESDLQKGNLLDIGSGTGAFLNTANKAGWSVTGLEPDEGAGRISADKYGIKPLPSDHLYLLPDGKYDAVTMWHVLEHVHELHEYLDQIKQVLKPGGIALIALPNYTSADAQYYGPFWAAYDVPRHLYHFSPVAFDVLVKKHGMKVTSVKRMWLDAFYIALLSERYKKEKTNLTAALWNGLGSTIHALKDKLTCSSLVYVIRPDKE